MSDDLVDIVNKNAKAIKSTVEALNKRMGQLEEENIRLRNIVQSCLNEFAEVKQSNGLALARILGNGATSGDHD